MPSSPLRDFTRSRVLGALERLSVPNAPTALLLDDVTRRILSGACRMSELMEAGQLTLVDNIHTRPSERSTEGYMHAIYLLSPTAESLDALIADYQEVAVYRGRCHLLLSSRLPAERLEQLRGCPLLMRHVHTLRELNVPFIALQAWRRDGAAEEEAASGCAFSLDAPHALAALYGPGPEAERASLLSRLAQQTAALCAALGEAQPQLRVARQGHPVCHAFGEALSAELDRAAAAASSSAAASASASASANALSSL